MSELIFNETTTPSAPASGKDKLYSKTTGIFTKNSLGVETGPFGSGSVNSVGVLGDSSNIVTVISGSPVTSAGTIQLGINQSNINHAGNADLLNNLTAAQIISLADSSALTTLTVGSTTVTSGTWGYLLQDVSGVLQNVAPSGLNVGQLNGLTALQIIQQADSSNQNITGNAATATLAANSSLLQNLTAQQIINLADSSAVVSVGVLGDSSGIVTIISGSPVTHSGTIQLGINQANISILGSQVTTAVANATLSANSSLLQGNTTGQIISQADTSAATAAAAIYANQQLSNLSGTVAINLSLLPGSDNSINLGSSTKTFASSNVHSELFYDSSGHAITLKANQSSAVTAHTLTLPSAQGSASQVLTNDGSGGLSWATPAATGANIALSNLASVAINTDLLPDTSNTRNVGSQPLPFSTIYSNRLHLEPPGLVGSANGRIIIQPNSGGSTYTLNLPTTMGSVNQTLTTDGVNQTSWGYSPLSAGNTTIVTDTTGTYLISNNSGMLIESLYGDPLTGYFWKSTSPAAPNQWSFVCYGNGLFVAVATSGTGNRIMTSPDGVNWTSRTNPENNTWYSVCYGNGLFVAVSSDGTNRVMTSPDGITWTSRSAASVSTWSSVTYGNGLFVATAFNAAMTSPDGITWTSRTLSSFTGLGSMTYGNGLFVALGQSGDIVTSPNGITWTSRTSNLTSGYGITYANGLFVAIGNGSGNIKSSSSPNGITWTSFSSPNTFGSQIAYGNGLFVVTTTGLNSPISRDGITWTGAGVSINGTINTKICFGNGIFVTVDGNGSAYSGREYENITNNHQTRQIFFDSSANTITLQAPQASSVTSYVMSLPTAQGSSGQALINDGSGNLSWSTIAGTGANTALSNLASVAINLGLTPGSDNSIALGSSSKRWSDTETLKVTLYDSSSHALTLQARQDAAVTPYTFSFPTTAGTNGYVLQTDGNGNTTWAAAGGGTVSSVGILGDSSGVVTVISGSPITSSGNIQLGLNIANIPQLNQNTTGNSATTTLASNSSLLQNLNAQQIINLADSSAVVSVGVAGDSSGFITVISGSPVTHSGTIQLGLSKASIPATNVRLFDTSNNAITVQANQSSAITPYTLQLPDSSGTAGQVLTDVNGNGKLSFTTVAGGDSRLATYLSTFAVAPLAVFGNASKKGLALGDGAVASDPGSGAPNSNYYNIAIGDGAISSQCTSSSAGSLLGNIIIGKGSKPVGTLGTSNADGNILIGNGIVSGNGTNIGTQSVVIGQGSTGPNAGYALNYCVGIGAAVNLGFNVGNYNTAVGYQATCNQSANNTAIGANSNANQGNCVALGYNAQASGGTGCISIGYGSQASNNNYATAIGNGANSHGAYSISLGASSQGFSDHAIAIGVGSISQSSYGVAIGPNSRNDFVGEVTLSPVYQTSAGDRKTSLITLNANTTTASQLELGTASAGSGSPDSYLNLPNNSTWYMVATFIGRNTTTPGSDYIQKAEFAIARDANAASTVIVGAIEWSTPLTRGTTTGWAVSITADTTNGRPAFQVTGASSTNISWACKVEMLKVI